MSPRSGRRTVRPFCPGTLEANSDLRLCGMANGSDADI